MTAKSLLLSLLAVPAIIACAGSDTAPDPTVPPTMTWVLHTANDRPAPALVVDRYWADDSSKVQIFVTADTIDVSSTGRYVQRAHLDAYVNGVLSSHLTYADHGDVTRDGSALHFVSNYLQDVAFDATMTDATTLAATQDLAHEDITARYVLHAR